MATFDVLNFESKEEPSNQWENIIGYIVAICASDNKCRSLIAGRIWILERKITHTIKSCAESLNWYPKLKLPAFRIAD